MFVSILETHEYFWHYTLYMLSFKEESYILIIYICTYNFFSNLIWSILRQEGPARGKTYSNILQYRKKKADPF